MKNIVLYIGSVLLPDRSAGAQRALSLSKSFRELGYQVVIVGMDDVIDVDVSVLETRSKCDGFETFAVPQPKNLKQWVHHTISISEFKKVVNYYGKENIHSIIAMEYEAVALWRLGQYCQKNEIRLIADAEEWYERSRLPFPMNIAKNIDTNLRMYWVYPRKIKNMICISRFFDRHYTFKIPHRVYIPGTIDLAQEKWKSLPQYVPNKVFTIGYAGHPGLHFEKERLDWLIQAVLELNAEGMPCVLKIAGVDRTFIATRTALCKDDENAIKCLGRISHCECLNMMALCDFSAIIREDKRVTEAGFPTKLSESFGCGTPVITTASSNISEYIIEGKTGLLCENFNAKAVKLTIKKAMQLTPAQLVCIHSALRIELSLGYQQYTDSLKTFLQKTEI